MTLLSPNYFSQGMNAFDDETKRMNVFDQQRASKTAGAAIASGDYQGGANALNQAGMLDQAHNVIVDQQAIQDRKTAADNLVADRATKSQQIKTEGLYKLTQAIKTVPEGGRQAWLQQNLSMLQGLGIPTDPFAKLDESHLTDAAVAPFEAELGKQLEGYSLGEGQKRFNGQNKEVAAGAPKPVEYVTVPEGGKAFPKPTSPAVLDNPAPMATTAPVSVPATGDPGALIDSYAKSGAATITSAQRTPEHNAEVGGVPNSHHLTNTARDLVPPPGTTIAQLAAEVQRRVPGAKVIQEADHVHVQWNAPQAAPQPLAHSGDPAGTLYGSPKQQTPPSGYRWATNGGLEAIPGGPAEASAVDDIALSPAAIHLLAGKYLNNGQLPPMGMGKTGTRNRTLILNAATDQAKALGLSADDLVAGTVTGKAAASAMGKVTAIRSQVEASEQTVLKNGQAALTLANQVGGPSQVPVINRWIQAGRKNIAGDAQVAAFNLAVGTVADEYAKAMTTNTGSGGSGTSDSARNEAYRRIGTAMTPEQLGAVIRQMKIEMDNRSSSLRDTETGLRNVVRSGGQSGALSPPPPPAADPATSAPTVIRYNAQGQRVSG